MKVWFGSTHAVKIWDPFNNKKVKLATIVEGDPKAPFSIAYYTKV